MSDEKLSKLIRCIGELTDEVEELKERVGFGIKPSYTNQEMLAILGVSQPTLRQWRNEGLIGYSQIGSTYQYSQKDVQEFLEHHHHDAYAF